MSEPAETDSDHVRRPVDAVTQRYVTLVLATFSLLVMTVVAFVVPLPYTSMQPGPVYDTLGEFDGRAMIQFDDDVELYDTDGALMLTTAMISSADATIRLPQALAMYLRPNAALVPSQAVNPLNETAEEARERAQRDMERSQANSEVAGLRAAGYEVGEEVTVAGVVQGGPSEGVLEDGDLLRAVNGARVETVEGFVAQVSRVDVGDEITVTVERDGTERDVAITTVEDTEEPGRPLIGIHVGVEFDRPIGVDNNLGHSIGGSSAGVIFALAIYDRLTPGSLTGGLRVAGTGEIDAHGTVGRIGGVPQKLAGAADADAQVFLVPEGNCAAAAAAPAFDLVVVSIADLDEAIAALEALGGAPDAADATARDLRRRAEDASLTLCQ